ncbi:MAG: LacI family DNA-binding transcriptional regulator [Phycisphaerae bacterium]|nr:LacI family DNA-binding transcriptional regulator [Phycisphaerae bacterium]
MTKDRTRTTLKTIAAEAGLGLSTVGLILNGRGDELGIPQKTQQRAMDVARRQGYRPNSLALGLVGKSTQTVGLLLPSSPFFPQNLSAQEISIRLYRKGYQTYLVDSLHDHDVILDALAEMAARRVDGVVFSTTNHMLTPEILRALKPFPVTVLMSHEPLERGSLWAHAIWETIQSGVDEMMDHFITTGRRKPMMAVNLGKSNLSKVAAFQTALTRHGLDAADEKALFNTPIHNPPRYDYYSYFLERFESQKLFSRDFDALFCTSDEGAAAAINYLEQHGRRVPEDVAVVGLNNAPWTRAMKPPLASISWRATDSWELVLRRLIERLNDPGMEPGTDELTTHFVRRDSAG